MLLDCHKYCPESLYLCSVCWLRLVTVGLACPGSCCTWRLFVCLSVCLFVRLLTISVKVTDWIFMKILPETYLWTRKSWLHFESYPQTESRRLWGILQHCKIGHFPTIWLISLENWLVLRENFIADAFLDKNVPSTFWKSSGVRIRIWTLDPHSRSGSTLQIWSVDQILSSWWRSAVSKCSCCIVFFGNLVQDWVPFPPAWLSQGIIVTDKTDCTEDDVSSFSVI